MNKRPPRTQPFWTVWLNFLGVLQEFFIWICSLALPSNYSCPYWHSFQYQLLLRENFASEHTHGNSIDNLSLSAEASKNSNFVCFFFHYEFDYSSPQIEFQRGWRLEWLWHSRCYSVEQNLNEAVKKERLPSLIPSDFKSFNSTFLREQTSKSRLLTTFFKRGDILSVPSSAIRDSYQTKHYARFCIGC